MSIDKHPNIIHDPKIKRIVVATYQAVSGAGKEAMDELYNSTKKIYENQNLEPKKFSKRIAFNVIPQIDSFTDDGVTKEEWKMKVENQKILDKKRSVYYHFSLDLFFEDGYNHICKVENRS